MRDRRLLGRDRETAEIARLLDGARVGGGALVIRGDAGIGKSALLSDARLVAADRAMTVVTAYGVRSETDLAFAGLHQLLGVWLAQVDGLPPLQRDAIRAAFGMSEATAPEPFMIALAALAMLVDAAARAPLLLAVEDAHWLDRPTADVLAFIGRRLEADSVVLLATLRDGYRSPLLEAGLPQVRLSGLSDDNARELLDEHFPDLTPAARERVLEAAEGNPLALLELPLAVTTGTTQLGGTVNVPLTTRLEDAFVSRAAELPGATRTLLRIAAADERASVAEVISAAAVASGARPSIEDLVPAMDAQLIDLLGTELHFRHPLVASALYQTASVAERQAAHAALARVLHDPDRQVWHRAAAVIGHDNDVAAELQEVGRRAQRRGANAVAAAAFERAGFLTADETQRSPLLLSAAEAAADLGSSELVMHLVREAQSSELGPRERALALWLEDGYWPGAVSDPARVDALTRAAEDMVDDREVELALKLAAAAAFRCYVGNLRGPRSRAVLDVVERIDLAPGDPRRLQVLCYAAPVECGATVVEHISDSTLAADPIGVAMLGTAASLVGAYERAAPLLRATAIHLREQGLLRVLAGVVVHQAWSAIQIADYPVAMPAAEEAERLAAETAQPALQSAAWAAQAVLAALRGERRSVEELTEAVEAASLPVGAAVELALAQYARGLAALGQGLHREAYDHLRRVYTAGDPAHHFQVGCFIVGDFVEAAVRSTHFDAARRVVVDHRDLTAVTPSPFFQNSMRYAQALVTDGPEAEDRFLAALTHEQPPMPFMRGRLQLAYGEWLRRQRRMADSRQPLREARDVFDAIGVGPWGERARRELRASGESSRRRAPHALDELTPQELQIVQMAAEGLSNREIGQRLYLSHRTVESHLYRVFPKLGVSSRAQLSAAIDRTPAVLARSGST